MVDPIPIVDQILKMSTTLTYEWSLLLEIKPNPSTPVFKDIYAYC